MREWISIDGGDYQLIWWIHPHFPYGLVVKIDIDIEWARKNTFYLPLNWTMV